MEFDDRILSDDDWQIATNFLGRGPRLYHPDKVLAPDGAPYLYCWHLVPRNDHANVYFHIQVTSDPLRPRHDHPWDNTTVVLSGGHIETLDERPGGDEPLFYRYTVRRKPGDVVRRAAEWAHYLALPDNVPYCMTLFSTGPTRRKWGFWYPEGWVEADTVITERNNVSIMKEYV